MHFISEAREEFLEGFYGNGNWEENYPSLDHAKSLAKSMTRCSDMIPRIHRSTIAEYMECCEDSDSPIPMKIRCGVSYGTVARLLLKLMP